MSKVVDLKKSVYELCKENPEVVDIMKEAGFANIAEPGMLNTAGRFMTIPKGAAMKGIKMENIVNIFKEKGYEVKE